MPKRKLTDAQVLARRFTCDDDRLPTSKQHTTPCAGCPWLRKSLKGYLGAYQPEDWVSMAHGEAHIDCHNTTNRQCAGAAIYRANVSKLVRDPEALVLEEDHKAVFSTPMEFVAHHKEKKL